MPCHAIKLFKTFLKSVEELFEQHLKALSNNHIWNGRIAFNEADDHSNETTSSSRDSAHNVSQRKGSPSIEKQDNKQTKPTKSNSLSDFNQRSGDAIEEHRVKPISQHTLSRLKNRLSRIQHDNRPLFSPQQIKTLSDEVLFSVVEGSLSHLPLIHGINIAIKLIRENRWQKPKGLHGRFENEGEGVL